MRLSRGQKCLVWRACLPVYSGLRSLTSNSVSVALNVGQDYCNLETLNVTCASNEVILVERASYGRMKLGRCATKDLGTGMFTIMQLFRCRLHTNDTSMVVGISSWLHHDMLCSQLIDDISLQRHSTHSCARFDVKVALFFCSIRSQLCAACTYTCSERTDVSSPVYCLYLTCCTLPNNDFQGSSVVVVTSSVTLRAGALRYVIVRLPSRMLIWAN